VAALRIFLRSFAPCISGNGRHNGLVSQLGISRNRAVRSLMFESIERLRDAMIRLHRCNATFVEMIPVDEVMADGSRWQASVAVFSLEGHDQAQSGYAWSSREQGGTRFVAVVGIPPIDSPLAAVRAALDSLRAPVFHTRIPGALWHGVHARSAD